MRPREIDDVLVNPGMGFVTGRSFNDDTHRKTVKGIIEELSPDFPRCSLAEFKLFWGEIEPEPDRYDFAFVDGLLKKARQRDQDISIRFMPWFPLVAHSTPQWFRERAKRSFRCKFNQWSGPEKGLTEEDFWAPDFNDPFFLERQHALLAAFGERYNGHPEIAWLDVGCIGNWGEWHTSNTVPTVPMPTAANAESVVDWHFKYWDRTRIVANFQNPAAFRYAAGKGAGWRCDGIDSPGIQARVGALLTDEPGASAWRRGPITGEPVEKVCRNPDRTLRQMLEWHASSVNWKRQPVTPTRKSVDYFLRHCGYRLVVRDLRHAATARAGDALHLRLEMENAGVAPLYRNYILAVRLSQEERNTVIETSADVVSWLPGVHVVETALLLPLDLRRGHYRLSLGLLDPHDHASAVRFANAGRLPDGWYPFSEMRCASAAQGP